MFGSQILEVAIGLVLVYLVLALIASSVREGAESFLKSRAVQLERGIREMLHDPDGHGFAKRLFEHPLIFGLYRGDYAPSPPAMERVTKRMTQAWQPNLPSYIPARSFASALLDIAAHGDSVLETLDAAPSIQDVRKSVQVMAGVPTPVRRAIIHAIDTADGSLEQARRNLEAWFDSGMDRVSGWYKRETQVILFFVSLGITALVNANTLVIAEQLYRNGDTRRDVVAAAMTRASGPLATQRDSALDAAVREIANLELPLGWPVTVSSSDRFNRPLGMAAGWLLTAFAITLGAPFWFDVLNKIMVIRTTVKPHEKSGEEGSEDRQDKVPRLIAVPTMPAAAPQAPPVELPASAAIPVGTPTSIVNARPPGGAPAPAVSFESHEWASGNDPHEGIL
ncbi:hypothetical protein J421_1311 [Gemmatirosa kalamazoonensis]|uniref:Uncharacterized protein n=1 Tax=Gemmatirosa kalamazoonensis TaxID=861299 RepID=W0RHG7_9BACT|nr:hypothetical protein [Gemmatirosa kalamazoonensis]AHG88848.1 hypothetical protein J421_1311 [Gemmatirosa kalamazoonensis]